MDAGRHPRIEILTSAEVTALEGEAGAFEATVLRRSLGVIPELCTGCGDCAKVCPVKAPNPFDVGLGTRKAIFRPFPQAVPSIYSVDPDLCLNKPEMIRCEACTKACPTGAAFPDRTPTERKLAVSAVVVATGFEEFNPSHLRRYGYSIYPNVLTSLELERLLNASGPTLGHVERPSDKKPPRNVVYVQCVGARGEDGRSYCSRFCCMNAVKDAMLLKQHDPNVESVTILYMDLRAFGKGFEEFVDRARGNDWIRFVRGRPSKITQTDGHDLLVHAENTEAGGPLKIPADMVVLSCAGQPSAGAAELARRLGVATNAMGFIDLAPGSSPVKTHREGIFVCGSATGPQVIPDCVAQGSAAATEAAALLRAAAAGTDGEKPAAAASSPAPDVAGGPEVVATSPPAARESGEGPSWARELPTDLQLRSAASWRRAFGGDPAAELPGGLDPHAKGEPGPGTSDDDATAASHAGERPADADFGQPLYGDERLDDEAADEKIRIGVFLCHCGINIAGTLQMPKLLEYALTLPGVVHASEELFACSSTSQAAIQEAVGEHGLNRVVVAACTPRTHEPIFRENCRAAGLNPYLVEMVNIRDQCSWVHAQAPEAATDKAMDLLRMATARAARLAPLTPTQVDVTDHVLVVGGGLPGMKAASDLRALGFGVTLIERGEELGGLVNQLHALYPDNRNPRADIEALVARMKETGVDLRLGTELRDVTGFVGNFTATLGPARGAEPAGELGELERLEVGAIVLAVGADTYRPKQGEFGYGVYENVITSVELEQRLRGSPTGLDGVQSVAFIQCVGSRADQAVDEEGHCAYPGCSRICCPTTVKQALELRQRDIDALVFYRDMRMVARGAEEMYRQARTRGTVFLRYDAQRPPQVGGQGRRADAVLAHDTLLHGPVRAPVDLVVLAVGLVPRTDDVKRIQEMLKTPKGPDGFFLERHPELGPVETCVDGVVVCGAAQGPKDLPDSLVQASAAAARVATLLGKGELHLDPAVCSVDARRCRACGLCASLCEFHAPEMVTDAAGRRVARINPALCKGCGTCAVWCPTGAIEAQHFTDQQITSMIDGLFCLEER